MWILGLNGLKLMRKMIMMMMVINVKKAKMKNRTIGDKDNDKEDHDCDFEFLEIADHYTFRGYKCPPTPPLSQHFVRSKC